MINVLRAYDVEIGKKVIAEVKHSGDIEYSATL
jgi:hypothetical protein